MNWFIKLSQLQPFLKSLGLSDDLINLIQKINIKEVRNKIIELIQTNEIKHFEIFNKINFLTSNYNILITLTDNLHYKKWLINKYLDYDPNLLLEDKEKFKQKIDWDDYKQLFNIKE